MYYVKYGHFYEFFMLEYSKRFEVFLRILKETRFAQEFTCLGIC